MGTKRNKSLTEQREKEFEHALKRFAAQNDAANQEPPPTAPAGKSKAVDETNQRARNVEREIM